MIICVHIYVTKFSSKWIYFMLRSRILSHKAPSHEILNQRDELAWTLGIAIMLATSIFKTQSFAPFSHHSFTSDINENKFLSNSWFRKPSLLEWSVARIWLQFGPSLWNLLLIRKVVIFSVLQSNNLTLFCLKKTGLDKPDWFICTWFIDWFIQYHNL